MAGTEDAVSAFWSPDSAWVAFFASGMLKKVPLGGGGVQPICALPRDTPGGGTWGEGGTIVFSTGALSARLFVVPAAGGEARPLTTLDEARGETAHWWPEWLPGGKRLLFAVSSPQEEHEGLYVASLDAPDERRRLLPGRARITYSLGHLLFVRDAALLSQPFDVGRLEVSGEPARVAENVASWSGDPTWGWFGASRSDVLAYREGGVAQGVQLAWFERTGERRENVGEPGSYLQIALSPDERRIALQVAGGEAPGLWVMDASRGVASRVTTDPAPIMNAVWSPDGQELAFGREAEGGLDLFRKGLRAGASAIPLSGSPVNDYPEDWSRDGKTLFYISEGALWSLSLEGDGSPELVLKTPFTLAEPRLSPDGRWLAYISNESGRWEVYVELFRRPGERVRVSVDGGGQPKWRRDGRELFYRSLAGPFMAVAVRETAEGLEVGLPTELFEAGVGLRPQSDTCAVSADGQRFLVMMPVGEDEGGRIHVVTHWTSLLE